MKENVPICILCGKPCKENEKRIKKEDWTKLKHKSLEWKGLDKYNEVFDSVDWGCEGRGLFWHKMCKCDICGERPLAQAISRKRKIEETIQKVEEEEKKENKNPTPPPTRKSTRQSVGTVNRKDLCIWCMKGNDMRHPDRDKFYKICEDKFWIKFKASVMYVQDAELKLRLQRCIDATSDPFSTEIW